MKILFLGNQRKYRGKGRGYFGFWYDELFREELARQADIDFYGWGYDPEWPGRHSIPLVLERFGKPDVIISSYMSKTWKGFNHTDGILKVDIAGDYYEDAWRLPYYKEYYERHKFDLVFGYAVNSVELLKRDGVGEYQYLLPFTVDNYIYRDLKLTKEYDVAAFFTNREDVYPYRKKIQEMIKEMDIEYWIDPVWFDEMVVKINQSRICINSNAKFKFITPRVTEVLSCGTFLLSDRNDEFNDLGYIDGGRTYGIRGLAEMGLGQYIEAVNDLDYAIDDLGYEEGWAYAGRGDCNNALGNYHEALADLYQAINLGYTDAWVNDLIDEIEG